MCLGALALLASSPAWANYSWGAFTIFRPGVQLGIVLLTLISETVVFAWLARVPWLTSAVAVVGANLLSGAVGMVLLEPNYLNLPLLAIAFVVSCLFEAIVLIPVAEGHRWRWSDGRCGYPWGALFAANLVSLLLSVGYVQVLYRGHSMPLVVQSGEPRVRSYAHEIELVAKRPDRSLRVVLLAGKGPAYALRACYRRGRPSVVDVAPAWAPWAQLRTLPLYEIGAVPEVLDAPGSGGRPFIWTGGPWVNGRRAVIFTDGSFQVMSERQFRKLGAVPQPPPDWFVQALARPPTQSPPSGTPRP